MPREVILDSIRFDKKLLLHLTTLFAHQNGTCLLYSGGNFDTSSCSFLCLFPFETISMEGRVVRRRHLETCSERIASATDPWEALKELLPEAFDRAAYPEWTGFFGYEMGAYSDRDKQISYLPAKTAPLYLQRSAIVIAVDHGRELGRIIFADQAAYMSEAANWVTRFENPEKWKELAKTLETVELAASQEPLQVVTQLHSAQTYKAQVEQVKEWILSGDLYQLNLSQQLSLKGFRDPFSLFYQLAELNPAPFSAYLRLEECAIVSSSPERLLKKERALLETRPIKGTMPRGKSEEEDRANRQTLLTSEKENAELLMITDLMRNDLGRVSLPGSVVTRQIAKLEMFPNVFHLLSIIQAEARPHLHPVDLMRSCFPGGSISGCPKIRAMERIAELEQRPRGIYTGSIGYFAGNGDFDFNIAIRTLVLMGDQIEVQLGGAITSDSDPQKEYEETLHKGASLFQVLGVKA